MVVVSRCRVSRRRDHLATSAALGLGFVVVRGRGLDHLGLADVRGHGLDHLARSRTMVRGRGFVGRPTTCDL